MTNAELIQKIEALSEWEAIRCTAYSMTNRTRR